MPSARTTSASEQRKASLQVVLAVVPPFVIRPGSTSDYPYGLFMVDRQLHEAGISSHLVRLPDFPFPFSQDVLEMAYGFFPGRVSLEEKAREVAEAHAALTESILSRLLTYDARVYGFSIWKTNGYFTLEIARRLKARRPDVCVILGGPQALQAPHEFQRDCIDAVMTDFHRTHPAQIVDYLTDGAGFAAPPLDGVWFHERYRKGGGGYAPPSHPDLSGPNPAHIDYSRVMHLYREREKAELSFHLNIGCPQRCRFCNSHRLYPKLLQGSPQRLIEQIQQIRDIWVNEYRRDLKDLRLHYDDAALNAKPTQFDELCRLLAARNWKDFHPNGMMILDERITPERARNIRAAGFDPVSFGLESGSERVRRAMRKPGTVASVKAALKTMKAAYPGGFRFIQTMFVIVGWPDETEAEFYETVAFIEWVVEQQVVRQVVVHPLFHHTHEREFLALDWRSDDVAGVPEIRYRRMVYLMERFGSQITVRTGVPFEIVQRFLAPDLSEGFALLDSGRFADHDATKPQVFVADGGNSTESATALAEAAPDAAQPPAEVVHPPYAHALLALLDPQHYPTQLFAGFRVCDLAYLPDEEYLKLTLTSGAASQSRTDGFQIRIEPATDPHRRHYALVGSLGVTIRTESQVRGLDPGVEAAVASLLKWLRVLDRLSLLGVTR